MRKSITRTIVLSLLCLHYGHAAHAAGLLDGIGGRLISENFPLETVVGVDDGSATPQAIPGCPEVKSFQVFEGDVPGQVVVALCKEGEFGPGNMDATVARQVAEARATLKNMPAPAAQFMLAGAEPVTVPLEGGREGKALTLPYLGHGLVLVPLAFALTPGKDATIVVQAYLNPNAPRNLNKPIAALLQGIYRRLRQ